MARNSEVRIILNVNGQTKVELYGMADDAQSKVEALELYCKLSFSIYELCNLAKEILAKNEPMRCR